MPTLRLLIERCARRLHRAKLVYGHGTTNPLDEAAFLVLEGLGLPQSITAKQLDRAVTSPQVARVDGLITERIKTRKPAPYIVGSAYIQGHRFRVDERVLVPRSFIGELLFSPHVIGPNSGFVPKPNSIRRVLDLCTGSGCLAILAAKVFPKASIDAVDLSEEALSLAQLNVQDYHLQRRVTLLAGDLYRPVKGERYDLIITNPPYVTTASMRKLPSEYRHEPRMALAAGADGLDLVKTIIKQAPEHLTPNGALLCEVGAARKSLERTFKKLPFFWLETELSADEVFWLSRDDLVQTL